MSALLLSGQYLDGRKLAPLFGDNDLAPAKRIP
jgi:hypothetical protein